MGTCAYCNKKPIIIDPNIKENQKDQVNAKNEAGERKIKQRFMEKPQPIDLKSDDEADKIIEELKNYNKFQMGKKDNFVKQSHNQNRRGQDDRKKINILEVGQKQNPSQRDEENDENSKVFAHVQLNEKCKDSQENTKQVEPKIISAWRANSKKTVQKDINKYTEWIPPFHIK